MVHDECTDVEGSGRLMESRRLGGRGAVCETQHLPDANAKTTLQPEASWETACPTIQAPGCPEMPPGAPDSLPPTAALQQTVTPTNSLRFLSVLGFPAEVCLA